MERPNLHNPELKYPSNLMPQDNYQYQSWPLPPVSPWGGSPDSNANIPQVESPNVPTAAALETPSPFDNGEGNGGGGGGGETPTCETSWQIGTVATSQVNLPCDTPRSILGPNALSLQDESGNTAELSAVNQRVRITGSSGSLDIDMADVDSDSGTIELKELDVCHLGAPGKRQFVCGNAYAA